MSLLSFDAWRLDLPRRATTLEAQIGALDRRFAIAEAQLYAFQDAGTTKSDGLLQEEMVATIAPYRDAWNGVRQGADAERRKLQLELDAVRAWRQHFKV